MLGLVDSFSDKWLAFLWEQTVSHYWLTCFSIPTNVPFIACVINLPCIFSRYLELSTF